MSVSAFLTDASLCIGCKACEVACKEWNQLPGAGFTWTGMSYDNTQSLGATTWRHVLFLEQPVATAAQAAATSEPFRWVFLSDVCKHCENAGCLEACPTGAIVRTEFGSVFVQPDVCNGCGYCVVACPFGVIDRHRKDGRAFKCTFCYDRQKAGLAPACAKACPTESIQFGEIGQLRDRAERRVAELRQRGYEDARLWDPRETSVGGVHAFFIVLGDPEAYNLPPAPELPASHLLGSWTAALVSAAVAVLAIYLAFHGLVFHL
jgi:formate dehydrogenase iron-sulfur subunit